MSDGAFVEGEEEFVDELKPGTKLMHGQYTIDCFLAAGGFGITYLAKDSLDRFVVIKECFPGSFCRRQNHSVAARSRAHQNELKSIVRLFSQEASSLSKAGHPNIVGVHQVFEENNTAYMALDYVQGKDLLEILTSDPGSLKPELVQGYLVKMLGAIGHVHSQGILHRDISPDNIIISEAGEPILIDFGAAREDANGKVSRMLSALRVVKDGYSPQEFYIAGSDQSPSCDLYSLAASFYHVITGNLPPDSQSRLTAFASNEEDPYVPLATVAEGYPIEFCTGLDKAMSILARDRMQSASDWQSHLEGEPAADTITASPKVVANGASTKKSPMPLLVGGVAVVAAAGIGLGYMSSPEAETDGQAAETTLNSGASSVTTPTAPIELDAASDIATPTAPIELDTASDIATPTAPIELDAASDIATPTAPIELDTASDIATPTAPIELDTASDIATPTAPIEADESVSGIFAQTAPAEQSAAPRTSPHPPIAPVVEVVADVPREAAKLAPITPATEIDAVNIAAESSALANPPAADAVTATSDWAVRLPFAASDDNKNQVGEVFYSIWAWLEEGIEVTAVDGVAIQDIRDIPGILRQANVIDDQTQINANLSTVRSAGGEPVQSLIILPIIQETRLNDGTLFESTFRGDSWRTSVAEVGTEETYLKVGDIVVEYLPTNTPIVERTSLADAISAGATSEFTLLVSRDDTLIEVGADKAVIETEDTADAIATPEAQEATENAVADATEGTVLDAPDETENAVLDVTDVASIVERDVRVVPFMLDANQPTIIETVTEDAPFWMVPGLEIISVAGQPVATNQDILTNIENADTDTFTVGINPRLGSAVIERQLSVGSETQTLLANGLAFKTKETDGRMITQVAAAPVGSSFKIGDTIIAYVDTAERLDRDISIKSILEREIEAGKTSFSFAVDREGEVWVEAFNLAALGQ